MTNTIAIGLLIAVIFSSLAFGAVEAWSVAALCAMVAVLLVLWVVKMAKERRVALRLPATVLPLGVFVLYAIVQSLTFAKPDGSMTSLSLDAEATRSFVPVLFCFVLAFLLAANVLDAPERLSKLYLLLTLYGLAYAVFALAQNVAGDGKLIWMHSLSSGLGSFVNRNHFAGFLEMLIPLPVAALLSGYIRKDARFVYGFAALLMGLALFVSLSRGGIISLIASMMFMALLATRRRERKIASVSASGGWLVGLKRAASVAGIVICLLAGLAWLAADKAVTRVAGTIDQASASSAQSNQYSRTWLLHRNWAMIRDHALYGVGLGAYETAFPAYDDSDGEWVVAQAHNDYLQILTDGGVIGGLLALWFLVLMLRDIWRAAGANDPVLAMAALGSGASVFAILVHSLFDFNLQIPANALFFLIHCAIVSQVAAAVRQQKKVVRQRSVTAALEAV